MLVMMSSYVGVPRLVARIVRRIHVDRIRWAEPGDVNDSRLAFCDREMRHVGWLGIEAAWLQRLRGPRVRHSTVAKIPSARHDHSGAIVTMCVCSNRGVW